MLGYGILRGERMMDSLKVVKKNYTVAFKNDTRNFLSFLPLIYIGYLLFKNVHYDILNPLQIMSSFASVAVLHAIVDSLMMKESARKTSILIKSLPLKERSIVIGFYIFSASIILSTALAASIFPAVKSGIEGDATYLRSTFIINIVICVFIFSILFPLIFKFGYSKMRIINTIIANLLLPLALVFYYIQVIYTKVYFISEAEYFINLLNNNLPATIIACLIIYLISMTISIKAYNKEN